MLGANILGAQGSYGIFGQDLISSHRLTLSW